VLIVIGPLHIHTDHLRLRLEIPQIAVIACPANVINVLHVHWDLNTHQINFILGLLDSIFVFAGNCDFAELIGGRGVFLIHNYGHSEARLHLFNVTARFPDYESDQVALNRDLSRVLVRSYYLLLLTGLNLDELAPMVEEDIGKDACLFEVGLGSNDDEIGEIMIELDIEDIGLLRELEQ
jgi:hypothetical protein